MGLQVNMCRMFNLPEEMNCPNPKCQRTFKSRLGDFDLECYEPQNGEVTYTEYCPQCENEFQVTITFNAVLKTT